MMIQMMKLISILTLALLSSCGTDRPFSRGENKTLTVTKPEQRTGTPAPEPAPSGEATLSRAIFESKVLPVLQNNCVACHDNPGPTYEKAIAIVKGGLPQDSRLYLTAIGKASHGGGEIFSVGSAEEVLLKEWILGTATP